MKLVTTQSSAWMVLCKKYNARIIHPLKHCSVYEKKQAKLRHVNSNHTAFSSNVNPKSKNLTKKNNLGALCV